MYNTNGVFQQINTLQFLADSADRTFKLGILSLADVSGTSLANLLISDNSTRNVYGVIASKGIIEDTPLTKGLGIYTAP